MVNADGTVKLADDLNISLSGEVYPDANNTGYIGIYGQQFYEIRGQTHYSNADIVTSDRRLKENIRLVENPLMKLLLLNGKKYDFIADSSDTFGTMKEQTHKMGLKKDRLGLLAQDVQEILPEAVIYDAEIDQYYIDYYAILTLSIEAFKEQQNELLQLSLKLESLKKQ